MAKVKAKVRSQPKVKKLVGNPTPQYYTVNSIDCSLEMKSISRKALLWALEYIREQEGGAIRYKGVGFNLSFLCDTYLISYYKDGPSPWGFTMLGSRRKIGEEDSAIEFLQGQFRELRNGPVKET